MLYSFLENREIRKQIVREHFPLQTHHLKRTLFSLSRSLAIRFSHSLTRKMRGDAYWIKQFGLIVGCGGMERQAEIRGKNGSLRHPRSLFALLESTSEKTVTVLFRAQQKRA